MKKQYLLPFLGLSAMMLSTSCSDENWRTNDFSRPNENTIFFSCRSQQEEENPIQWTEDSKLGYFCPQTKISNYALKVAAISAGQPEGLFYTQAPWSEAGGEHEFYLYTPYSATNTSEKAIAGTISDVQVQTGTSKAHLTANDLQYASAKSAVVDNKAVPMTFKHAIGYLDVTCISETYKDWNMKSIMLSNADNIALTGKYNCDLTTGLFTMPEGIPNVRVNFNDAPTLEAPFHVYAAVNPTDLSGKEYEVTIMLQKADEDDMQLTGKVNAGNIVAGNFNELNIELDGMVAESTNKSINLSVKETANCYIVGKPGQEYRFNATVMGNGVKTPATEAATAELGTPNPTTTTIVVAAPGIVPTTLDVKSVKLLWQTSPNLISGVTLKRKDAYFTVNGSDTTPLEEGNAVIAAYSGLDGTGDILWSWHIWVTADDIKTETYNIHADYNAYGNLLNPELMDRNLGATATGYWGINNDNSAHGLYYQWGRKDPFPKMDDSSKTSTKMQATYKDDGKAIAQSYVSTSFTNAAQWSVVTTSVSKENVAKYPMCFIATTTAANWLEDGEADLWGNPSVNPFADMRGTKTIYDPCPAGYQMPHTYVFSGFTNKATGGSLKATPPIVVNFADGNTTGTLAANAGATYNVGATPSFGCGSYIDNKSTAFKSVGTRTQLWSSGATTNVNNANSAVMFDGSNNFNTPASQAKTYGYQVRCMKIKK